MGTLVEALRGIARAQRSVEGRHVIVALAPEMAQVSSVTADAVLDELRDTGALFYAVTIATTSDNLRIETQRRGLIIGGPRRVPER